MFKIYSEGGVAAGIRRVEATTGANALAMMNSQLQEFHEVARELRAQPGAGMVEKAVKALLEEKKALEKELAKARSKLAMGQGQDLASQAVDVKGAKVLVATLDGADAKTLRETHGQAEGPPQVGGHRARRGERRQGGADRRRDRRPDRRSVKAGELVNFVAQQVGGKGGGRPDMAQAGGTEPAKLPGALQSVKSWVEERV